MMRKIQPKEPKSCLFNYSTLCPRNLMFQFVAFNEILALGVKSEEYHRNHAKCHEQCAKNKSFFFIHRSILYFRMDKISKKTPEI